MTLRAPVALIAILVWTACPQPEEPPGPEVGASYLGLSIGQTFNYDDAASGLTEKLEVKQSSLLLDGKLVFDLFASQNGFQKDERTFTIAVDADEAVLARFFDCVTQCAQPSAPIPFLQIPLKAGQAADSSVELARSSNGVDEGTATEQHAFVVAGPNDVTVPAGTFSAYTVTWTRTRDEQSDAAVLKIAPETGIISWLGFDGAQLQLAP